MSRKENSVRLIDKVLEISRQERSKQPFAKIQTRDDLLLHMPLLVKILNSDPELGLLFLADPLKFLEKMEIQISDEVRTHLEETLPKSMQPSKKTLELNKQDKFHLASMAPIHFELPSIVLERLPRYQAIIPQKDYAKLSFMERMMFWGIDQRLERIKSISHVAESNLSANKGDWDIVVEIRESFLRDLWYKIFVYQYVFAALLKASSGVEESSLVEPWHEIYTWFLIYFHVKLTFNISQPPEISLDTSDPGLGKLIMKFNAQILGRVNFDEEWSEISTCSATAEIVAGLKKTENGYFAGQALKNYFALDLTNNVSIVIHVIDGIDDALLNNLIIVAINDYLRVEIPELPLTPPLSSAPPFVDFSYSQLNAIDLSGQSDAIVISWSQQNIPIKVQSNFIKSGKNFVLGLSSAVTHYLIRSKLLIVPFRKDDVEITQIDAELREGYIHIYGKGVYHTGSCWPNYSFSFTVKISLFVNADGKLDKKTEVQVDVNLSKIEEIIAALVRSATLVDLDGLIDSIATTIAGKQIEDSVGGDLDFSDYVEMMFSAPDETASSLISLNIKISEVEVNRNGVFFHGNLEARES